MGAGQGTRRLDDAVASSCRAGDREQLVRGEWVDASGTVAEQAALAWRVAMTSAAAQPSSPGERVTDMLASMTVTALEELRAVCLDVILDADVTLSILRQGDDPDFRELYRRQHVEASEILGWVLGELARRASP